MEKKWSKFDDGIGEWSDVREKWTATEDQQAVRHKRRRDPGRQLQMRRRIRSWLFRTIGWLRYVMSACSTCSPTLYHLQLMYPLCNALVNTPNRHSLCKDSFVHDYSTSIFQPEFNDANHPVEKDHDTLVIKKNWLQKKVFFLLLSISEWKQNGTLWNQKKFMKKTNWKIHNV